MSLSRRPVTIIKDPLLRHPHSVAFTPATSHLVVTNAGANYFTVYAPERRRLGTRWSHKPVAQVIAHDDDAFKAVNMTNKTEGGPKGVAVSKDSLVVCSPQIGIKIYSFREGWK
jgi:DNA-binding beta-propeller fold protein YncE